MSIGTACIVIGIAHIMSEEFARKFMGGYKRSEDGTYPPMIRIALGITGIFVGIWLIIVGAS